MLDVEKKEILRGIVEYQEITSYEGIKEIIEAVKEADFNFNGYDYIEALGVEIRIIPSGKIDVIYRDTIKEIVEDCYDLKLDDIPSFIAFNIDWNKTADNCLVDGYGHTFSSYDGSEHETRNYYYFRTN